LHALGQDYVRPSNRAPFIVYIPFHNQDLLPILTLRRRTSIFLPRYSLENRFCGSDRLVCQSITLAGTSVYEQSSGIERLKVALGERFVFTAQQS